MQKWFLNLKIANKVAVLVGFIMFCLLVSLTLGYFVATDDSKAMKGMYEERLMAVQKISDCNIAAIANILNVYNLMLVTDSDRADEINEKIKIRSQNFIDNLKYFQQKTNLNSEEKDYLSKVEESVVAYKAIRAKALGMIEDGQQRAAFRYFEGNYTELRQLSKALDEFAAYEQKIAKENYSKVESANAAVRNFIVIFAILAIVFSSLFGLYVVNMFQRRLGNLVKLTNIVAGGDFTYNAKIEATDEIGVLVQH